MKSLNGYQLILQLKKMRADTYLSVTDQALFHELVSICNEKKWPDEFFVKNDVLCSNLNISAKTLIKSKKVLVESGLLFSETFKNKKYGCKYSFIHEVSCRKIPDESTIENAGSSVTSSGKLAHEVEIPPYNINIKTIKQEKDIPLAANNNLRFPYSSEDFLKVWNILRNTPRWKKKTDYALQVSLDKLARYSEEFAIYQMNRAIESGWTGVVFIPGTDREYEEWKQLKQNTYEKNRKLSKADKERLLLEEYAAIVSGNSQYRSDDEVLNF